MDERKGEKTAPYPSLHQHKFCYDLSMGTYCEASSDVKSNFQGCVVVADILAGSVLCSCAVGAVDVRGGGLTMNKREGGRRCPKTQFGF
jgi:hypothetical protein